MKYINYFKAIVLSMLITSLILSQFFVTGMDAPSHNNAHNSKRKSVEKASSPSKRHKMSLAQAQELVFDAICLGNSGAIIEAFFSAGNANLPDLHNNNLLEGLVDNNQLPIARLLLQSGARTSDRIMQKIVMNVFEQAAVLGNLEAIKELMYSNPTCDAISNGMRYAVGQGHVEVVTFLLTSISPSLCDEMIRVVLKILDNLSLSFIERDHYVIIQHWLILKKKLLQAIKEGNVEELGKLLRQGANADDCNESQQSFLWLAAHYKDINQAKKMVKLLLRYVYANPINLNTGISLLDEMRSYRPEIATLILSALRQQNNNLGLPIITLDGEGLIKGCSKF